MDNNIDLDNSWPYIRQAGRLTSAGVAGDPNLFAGLLLGYSLLGLVSFSLVFWFQRSRLSVLQESIISSCFRYYVKNTHDVLCALIFTDALIVITAVVMAIQGLTSTCSPELSCVIVFMIWFLLRYLGIVFHLLAALCSIVFLSPPQWANKLRIAPTVLIVLVIVFLSLSVVIGMISIFVVAVFIFALSLGIIVKCAMPTVIPSTALWKKLIVLVAMLTLFITFIPTFVLQCLILNFGSLGGQNDIYSVIYANILLGTNLNVVLDALLCFFILKLPAGGEQQQLQRQQRQHR